MKLDEIEIFGVKYSFEAFDDSTDIIVRESFVIPTNKVVYATMRINHDFIPAEDSRYIEDSFAPENRWY